MAELRQLGDFITPGEEEAARRLERDLPATWTIIANKMLPMQNGTSREIDLIVVGPHRLFLLDEKGIRGPIIGDDQYWYLVSRESRPNPLNKMEHTASRVAGDLRQRVAHLGGYMAGAPFVQALVVLSDPTATMQIMDTRRDRIVRLDDCAETLKRLDTRGHGATSLAPFRSDILKTLNLFAPRPSLPRTINEFIIRENLGDGPYYRAFLATHETGGANALRRLKLYRLDGLTHDERQKQKELYRQEYLALLRLAESGLAPGADLPFTWGEEQYYVVPQKVLSLPTLRVHLAPENDQGGKNVAQKDVNAAGRNIANRTHLSNETTNTVKGFNDGAARLDLAHGLLSALAELHANNILHRNLTPDTIYYDASSRPARFVFADFDFARREGENSIAALADPFLSELPYRAPELDVAGGLGLAYADQTTDLYAIGVILAELFTGQDAQFLRNPNGGIAIPELPDDDTGLTEGQRADLRDILEAMTARESNHRYANAAEARDFLAAIIPQAAAVRRERESLLPESDMAQQATDNADANAPHVDTFPGNRLPGSLYQKGDVIEDRYRVEAVLGQGATANTYLVFDETASHHFVLKQVRDPEHARRLAKDEFRALNQLQHQGIVRVYEVYKADAPFHLKIEFVRGDSLEDRKSEFPWSLSRIADIGKHLLEALEYLESRGIAHRDLSARNILLTPEGQPKIIDFGFAAAVDSIGRTQVGTPIYRAPELDRGEGWNSTCDRYALGVLLWQMLTGILPFQRDLNERYNKNVLPPLPPNTEKSRSVEAFQLSEVLGVLQKAIDPDPANRFDSSQEFCARLREAATRLPPDIIEGERNISQAVIDIQGVYRNSRIGNAGNRGLEGDDFASRTYIQTKLDTDLAESVLNGAFDVVLLSGNPGDGKTAFLEKLCETLDDREATCEEATKNGWRYFYKGRTFAANLDASESSKGRRADELLEEILAPLAGDNPPTPETPYTALLAINDGKLRDFLLEHNRERYGWLAGQVQSLLDNPESANRSRIALVDLKQRSVVGDTLKPLPVGDGGDLFGRILNRFLNDAGWSVCLTCRVRPVCPMRFNRDSLADPTHGPQIQARLRALFQLTHLRRNRHITMRDLRSALAYIVAGTASCETIHEELENGGKSKTGEAVLPPDHRLYFQAAFNPDNEGEDNLRDFAGYDPGETPAPRLDRFLHFRRGQDRRREIETMLLQVPNRASIPVESLTYAALDNRWYAAMKRRLWFEGDPDRLAAPDGHPQSNGLALLPEPLLLLPYRHFAAFLAAIRLAPSDPQRPTALEDLRDRLCEAISRANGIVNAEQYRKFLCVRTTHNRAVDLTVFKRFPCADFVCDILPVTARQIETLPNALILRHKDKRIRAELIISLDLFELLMRFTEGYRPGVEEQEPLVADLAQFQNRLLNVRADELLLLEGGRNLHRVRQSNGIIELVKNAEPDPAA